MPKIFEQDGFSFFFYTNEHLPIHVHVMRGGVKAKFHISETEAVLVKAQKDFSKSDLGKAQKLALKNSEKIIKAWKEYFNK